jgi:hypothetical protein
MYGCQDIFYKELEKIIMSQSVLLQNYLNIGMELAAILISQQEELEIQNVVLMK